VGAEACAFEFEKVWLSPGRIRTSDQPVNSSFECVWPRMAAKPCARQVSEI